jgi:hypothetical protein
MLVAGQFSSDILAEDPMPHHLTGRVDLHDILASNQNINRYRVFLFCMQIFCARDAVWPFLADVFIVYMKSWHNGVPLAEEPFLSVDEG